MSGVLVMMISCVVVLLRGCRGVLRWWRLFELDIEDVSRNIGMGGYI